MIREDWLALSLLFFRPGLFIDRREDLLRSSSFLFFTSLSYYRTLISSSAIFFKLFLLLDYFIREFAAGMPASLMLFALFLMVYTTLYTYLLDFFISLRRCYSFPPLFLISCSLNSLIFSTADLFYTISSSDEFIRL